MLIFHTLFLQQNCAIQLYRYLIISFFYSIKNYPRIPTRLQKPILVIPVSYLACLFIWCQLWVSLTYWTSTWAHNFSKVVTYNGSQETWFLIKRSLVNYSSITTDFTLRHSIHCACTETSFRRTYFYSSINFRMLICGFFLILQFWRMIWASQ